MHYVARDDDDGKLPLESDYHHNERIWNLGLIQKDHKINAFEM